MRGFLFPKIIAGLRAGYQLWGSSSEKADIHRNNSYCVVAPVFGYIFSAKTQTVSTTFF
jgi:hypothetical protein